LLSSQRLKFSNILTAVNVWQGFGSLLRMRHWIHFLIIAFTGGMAGSVSMNFFFPYMASIGAHEATMGIALAIGTLSEIPVYFFGSSLIVRLRPSRLLIVAMAAASTRLLLLGLISEPLPALFVQVLSGLTLPTIFLAGVSFATENAPRGLEASAQGLVAATVLGIGMAAGGFMGGMLLEPLGERGLFLVTGATVLAIVVLTTIIFRGLPADQQTAPSTNPRTQKLRG
jgi:predicted MFS family arabinose efflux permease